MVDEAAGCSIERQGQVLVFRTARFTADRGSVLHRGIYNREMASSLVSFAAAGVVYMVLARRYGKTLLLGIVFLAFFVAGFLLMRRFVFRERYLEALFDAGSAKATIRTVGVVKGHQEVIPFEKIVNLRIDRSEKGVENPDGVAFVQKIAAQHGTVIPGFGEEAVFYVLKVVLSDGATRTLYAGQTSEDALAAYDAIREFTGLSPDSRET